jgi:DNA-binding winged helix-turn-helix (wHTH) protein
MRIQFGECTFDAVRREVRRGTQVARLSPKAFELLRLLVESRPRALAKDELFERLWPKTFVSEANLAGLVAEIRREIGDDAREPRFVRTVHGFGYAFSDGAVAAADEDGVFRLIWGLEEVPLTAGENILGRDPEAAVRIDDATVSRHHARIVIHRSRAALEDLGSKNGTWLRGERIATSASLSDGDEIRVGSVAMTFRCFPAGGSTATQIE